MLNKDQVGSSNGWKAKDMAGRKIEGLGRCLLTEFRAADQMMSTRWIQSFGDEIIFVAFFDDVENESGRGKVVWCRETSRRSTGSWQER